MEQKLFDIAFADDIALLDNKQVILQKETEEVAEKGAHQCEKESSNSCGEQTLRHKYEYTGQGTSRNWTLETRYCTMDP